MSGPLLDRIDIQVEVPPVRYRELATESPTESSHTIRGRVEEARRRQLQRFGARAVYCNAQMAPRDMKPCCDLDAAGKDLIERALTKLGLSARAYTRILKVARTIADLEGADGINAQHIAEAIQYRSLDRTFH